MPKTVVEFGVTEPLDPGLDVMPCTTEFAKMRIETRKNMVIDGKPWTYKIPKLMTRIVTYGDWEPVDEVGG